MALIGDTVQEFVPRIGTENIGVTIVTWLVIIIVLAILAGIATWIIIMRLRFKYKVNVFEKINGRFEPSRKDRAMEMKLGRGGDYILYLKRHKKFLPLPSLQTGRKTYWFFIRQDGEWINFSPGDFDENSRQLNAEFLDKEMRYARTQIQRGLKERYDQPGWWQKYGMIFLSIVYIVIIGVMFWLFLREWVSLAGRTTDAMTIGKEVLERANQILASLDNICQGGAGFTAT